MYSKGLSLMNESFILAFDLYNVLPVAPSTGDRWYNILSF